MQIGGLGYMTVSTLVAFVMLLLSITIAPDIVPPARGRNVPIEAGHITFVFIGGLT